MRAKPKVLKEFAREAFEGGASLRAIARAAELPLGTVKAWRNRGQWVRSAGRDATPVTLGRKGADATGAGGVAELNDRGRGRAGLETHRGLRGCHMPGRKGSKQMTFALFKRNLWPPAEWRVPGHLVGGELLMMLQERACLGLEGKGRKGKN